MMPTMVTFRAGTRALIALAVLGAAACSYEQQDWRSAESADSSEAWARFVDQHPDSELVSQARARSRAALAYGDNERAVIQRSDANMKILLRFA